MSKTFNTSVICKPEIHYMVDIHSKLAQIKDMIDQGKYFTINRARQYGKTTTLRALESYLKNEYIVISIDFQMLSYTDFEDEKSFVEAFSREILDGIINDDEVSEDVLNKLEEFSNGEVKNVKLAILFRFLSSWCKQSQKPIVLMIDEVDSATNNQVFIDFLSQLRGYYIKREMKPIFQSVVLAGVYDIKNIKRKLRPDEEHKENSPWNVAEDFLVDMSFSVDEIKGMIDEYEHDYHTGMNLDEISNLIYEYTSGYPFLVSRICKLIDERVVSSEEFPTRSDAWTKNGFLKAIRILLIEENTLFESLDNKLIDYPQLKEMLSALLLQGKRIEYIPGNEGIRMAIMFGFVVLEEGIVKISNRIFEMRLYNGFLAEKSLTSEIAQK